MGRVIGIMSGKGGVGKTTIALNLGLAIHQFGHEVVVIDGDVKNPNLGLYLGIYSPPLTVNDIIKKDIDLNIVKHTHSSGIDIVPAPLLLSSSGLGLTRLRDIFNKKEGYFIIDFPPGLGKETMSLLDICDEVLIITNPNIPSVASTMRVVNIVKSQDKNILGVLVNMAGKSYEIELDAIETVCSAPLLGELPEDENVRKSAMLKTPVLDHKPYSKASLKFKDIAAKITGSNYKKPQLSGLRSFFSSI